MQGWSKDPQNTHVRNGTNFLFFYSAIEKNKILPCAATWMDLEGFM